MTDLECGPGCKTVTAQETWERGLITDQELAADPLATTVIHRAGCPMFAQALRRDDSELAMVDLELRIEDGCPGLSSLTGQPCLEPAGHRPWRGDRFHHYAQLEPTDPGDKRIFDRLAPLAVARRAWFRRLVLADRSKIRRRVADHRGGLR